MKFNDGVYMLTDTEAMNNIATILDREEWDSSTLDDIALNVRVTGRTINDLEEDE